MGDTDDLQITLQDDGPVLIILFLLVCIISIAWQISENDRLRRKLAVVAGPNQEMRTTRRMFFYTVLIIGLVTLLANYIVGVTSSLAAAHINEVRDPVSLLSLPGVTTTLVTISLYALAIVVTAGLMEKKQRLGFPELLADLNDARKFGGLENQRQIGHYQEELHQLQLAYQKERTGARSTQEFDRFFTSHEVAERPELMQQLSYLRREPEHQARARSLHRNLFLNYRMAAGKWTLLFSLLTVLTAAFTLVESTAAKDDGDYSLALAWAVACLLSILATAGQYFCDVGQALLESRRRYITAQTALACQKILKEATEDLAATVTPMSGVAAPNSPDPETIWESFVQFGRWEARRRKR